MPSSLKFFTREIVDSGGLSLKEAVASADFEPTGLEIRMAGPIAVQLDFSVGSSQVLLSGEFKGDWELECSRCLTRFTAPYSGLLEETYPLEQPEIDAGEELRQGILLALPSKPLCKADCKGLCPKCGRNLNAGPCGCRIEPPSPFEELKKLRTKSN